MLLLLAPASKHQAQATSKNSERLAQASLPSTAQHEAKCAMVVDSCISQQSAQKVRNHSGQPNPEKASQHTHPTHATGQERNGHYGNYYCLN
jgi:hypothetical protein